LPSVIENHSTDSRAQILALLSGKRGERVPCFSGLIHITAPGLEAAGLRLSEIHTDPAKMAAAAATTFQLFGFASAVVPTDLCVEAGALGARVDFREDSPEPAFPLVSEPLAASVDEFRLDVHDVTRHERVAAVIEAIRLLKRLVGAHIVVGAWVPGPLTLAMQVIELSNFYVDIARTPEAVARVLDPLTDVLAQVASAYCTAGADFITVHEMGGSPGVIGPGAFERLALPRLQRLIAALPAPRVLSVCGNTNRGLPLLIEAGAEALSVDQTNDLARSRDLIGTRGLLFGNIDPVAVLAEGEEGDVRRAVRAAISAGADAVWPGCDLVPLTPALNLRAMMEEMQRPSRS
jgi:MtaA/CmuA family methyltransferase